MLVVSDNRQDIEEIRALLDTGPGASIRFHVESEEDYHGALKSLVRNKYDVYLVDQIVPNSQHSGIDLIKRANAGGCSAPVLLLTSMADEDIEWAIEDCGAVSHVNKTLDFTERTFQNAVRYAIRHYRAVLEVRDQLRELQKQVSELVHRFNRAV